MMHERKKSKVLIKIANMQAVVKTLYSSEDIHDSINFLADELVSIGETLVCCGEEGIALISDLEDLADSIKKVRIAKETSKSFRASVDILLDKLAMVRNMVVDKIPNDRKLVFFLPYKASMWDSLESVWEKADADDTCDAVVMPIPYFDRNSDRTIKEWHWEGNDFPDYVPITDYREINLAEIHPDQIYIHNPYDAYNWVTSVATEYYSDKLKQYTDELIYIPYFVSDENSATPETVEIHAKMPVYVHADVIVQQSEKMRGIYIEALVNIYGEHTREIWEQKIKGWGSPKFDKVRSVKKDENNLPADWLKKIKKADGSWKKVIMYGTGLGEMLRSENQLLNKIENVLQFFQKKTDDIMLLWRPHPLIPPTLDSMRPELSERYAGIVENYKKADWGIFDDTTDLNRSIAICDAYYGDDSSVIQLFQAVKKPVMVEDVEIMN